ncbi:MAG: serine/threonine-protein kinase [Lachnospiraceae bacterium]|nr:serine/threonine-protein kinase [Lachnospiraceae bacterium]
MSYIFADRYRVVKTLYQSTATRVLLVKPQERDELLVVKCIRKQNTSTDIFLEANLLQDMRHPGIPILYEIIEDETTLYLIQEYVYGDSLDHYLLYHQHISQETFLQFAIQICEIIQYLHSHQPDPILYLDMKPSHIIVCGERVKLIDFGIANFLSISGKNIHKFGTKKYAAPEQMTNEVLDKRTDVYGVGKVLAHMLTYMEPREAVRYFPIVWRATRKRRCRRTESISRLKQQLIDKGIKKNRKHKNKKHLKKVIAVVGSDRGVGCTHIAIALVNYLNQAGLNAYYRNCSEQRVLEQMAQQEMISVQKDGFIYHESFRGVMYYDPRETTNPPEGIQIIDCGCNDCPKNADATIYVCGGRLWQKPKNPTWKWGKDDIVLCNFFAGYQARKFAREQMTRVYFYPYQKDPFVVNTAIRRLFSIFCKSFFNK